jgi:HlyD family secretion protein
MKKIIILLILAALVGGGVGTWYVRSSGHQATTFRTAVAKRGNLSATINATGTLEPQEVVDVGAQVAGQVVSFGTDPQDPSKPIDYLTQVKKDTVLARIDPQLFQSQVDQAEANLLRAKADLLNMQSKVYQTERDWKRAQALGRGSRGSISDLDYDTAEYTYRSANSALGVGKSAVKQAEASLNQAKINLGYTTIKSPVKGVIIDRRVNIGQTVVSSLNAPSLFLLAKDLTKMQVWASVNEADIGQIQPKQKVHFGVDALPGRVFHGEVYQVRLNATMTQNVVTYTVVVTADNSDLKLKPYLTANVEFEVSDLKNVLLVPNAALRFKPAVPQVAPDIRPAFAKEMRQRQAARGTGGEMPAPTPAEKERHDQGVVWVQDGEFLRPVKVTIGLSDGAVTQVTGGDLKDDTAVVTGEIHQAATEDTNNPFAPKLFGKK